MVWSPQLFRVLHENGDVRYRLGHELVDAFLEFAAGRARPNTVRAYAHDLKTFFSVVEKDPIDVTPADVLSFVAAQQQPRPGAENVVRFPDASSGLSPATVMRRLAAVSAFYGYLLARADTPVVTNPVPHGLPTRCSRRELRGTPLVRGVRRLPRILDPEEAVALLEALRTQRDRAIVEAMLLGGLRRSEVLGLRLGDIRLGECRVFVAEGKGGHERLVPCSPTFFATLAAYLECERPTDASTDRVFVVLKGPRRGGPLSTEGLDEVMASARKRAGLSHGTCHELRHTCLTRLREAGMSLEALQAQAGHRSIASTQIYLHLGADWLAAEYRRAAEAIEAELSCRGSAMSGAAVPTPTTLAPLPSLQRAPKRSRAQRAIGVAGTRASRFAPLLAWEEIAERAPGLAATMTRYLAQIAVSSRPGTVSAADLALRVFADHVVEIDPSCGSVSAIGRHHIESYKIALAARPGKDPDKPTSVATIRNKLGMLRTFFERLIEWDDPDAPRKVPIFAGDFPKADEPLPRFLDDPTYAKFMATLSKDPNHRRRLIVELLARTGMRVGEVGGLRDDAVFRLGTEHWLRIPVGKLHNDRTVPLHPVLLELITNYRVRRGPSPSGLLVVRDDGQAFDRRTIHRYVASVAKRAGTGHVHPHQLRHTLATHCINRGMSLEAIAAMLGHRSPRMTLVYARISNDSVAKQYFRAIEAVERVGIALPGNENAAIGAPMHRRQLANGHCTRPALLDCSYQTICEGCGFFQTDPEFLPILQRQRDDAATLADFERARIFKELINGLTKDEPRV